MIDIASRANSEHKVELVDIESKLYVRKYSNNTDVRFEKAIKKQREFNAISLGNLSITGAPVLEVDNSEESKHSFLMPYIHGISGEDFALVGTKEVGYDLSRALNAILIDQMACAKITSVSTSIFKSKISSVITLSKKKELSQILIKCEKKIQSIFSNKSTTLIPIGFCHGDLTLSNIIMSPAKGIVLIDFLPTFLESPLQDLAKLKQDINYGWSFRRLDNPLKVKAKIFCNSAAPSYMVHLEAEFPKACYALEILCLARIAPYVKDDVTLNWLIDSLELCINSDR
jgi:hypothetical protein